MTMINTSDTQQPNNDNNVTVPTVTPAGEIASEEKAYLYNIRTHSKQWITPQDTPHNMGEVKKPFKTLMNQPHIEGKDYDKGLDNSKVKSVYHDYYNNRRRIWIKPLRKLSNNIV